MPRGERGTCNNLEDLRELNLGVFLQGIEPDLFRVEALIQNCPTKAVIRSSERARGVSGSAR